MIEIQSRSVITCPACGHQREESMPDDACQFFYRCAACGELLRPQDGDCCVFCSYGSVPCPPVQRDPVAGGPCCDVSDETSGRVDLARGDCR